MFRTVASVTIALTVLAGAAYSHESEHADPQPPWQAATGWPDRIVITLPASPQRSFAVTWRTDATVEETVAEIVEATSDARFDLGATQLPAKTEQLDVRQIEAFGKVMDYTPNTGVPPAHFHSVVFEDLKLPLLCARLARSPTLSVVNTPLDSRLLSIVSPPPLLSR